MEVHEVKELMEQFDKSSLSTLELVFHDTTIKMCKPELNFTPPTPAPHTNHSNVVTPPPPPVKLNLTGNCAVTAPVGGVFYVAPQGENAALWQIGDRVNQGDILCYIESMQVMTQVKAPVSGVLKEISVPHENLVGYGDLIMQIGE